MRVVYMAVIVGLATLAVLAVPGLGQGEERPCPEVPGHDAENLTAEFAGDRSPPVNVFAAQHVSIPLVVEKAEETPPEAVNISIATGRTDAVPLDTAEEVMSDGEAGQFNLSFPASKALEGNDTVDLHLCLNGEPLTGEGKAWTMDALEDYELAVGAPSYRSHSAERKLPDLPTTHSLAKVPLTRSAENLSRYTELEDEDAVEIQTRARLGDECPTDAKAPEPTRGALPPDVADAANETEPITINLTQAPPCEITFTFTLHLVEERCAADECRVSSNATRTFVVHRPWDIDLERPPNAGGPPFEVTVWAPENDVLPQLEGAIERDFQSARDKAYTVYGEELKRLGPDASRVGGVQRSYEKNVQMVEERFIQTHEDVHFVQGLDEAESRFTEIVDHDRSIFEDRVETYLDQAYTASDDEWWAARELFGYGFGATLSTSFLGFLFLTRRWQKKRDYWSMFSSKASFTHPLRAAGIVAVVAGIVALVLGLLHEAFTLHRILGIPADLWGLIG